MTRCPECSEASGVDVDHVPAYHLPPLLVRFEHFLATKGNLGRPIGAPDPTLPTRGGAVPTSPMSPKHRATATETLVEVLTELGYLEHGGPGRWTSVQGKDPRDVSAKQVLDYLTRRFPPDTCKTHRPKECKRCCLPHHLSMYNKVCEAFRKMAEWLHFTETLYGKPAWSKDKLVAVYGVTRRRPYVLRPPRMNDVESAHRFQEWLEGEDKLYGYMVWFLQEFGARYEEMVHAEFPPVDDGSGYFTLNRRAGVVEIRGKGRDGGKVREVTLTPAREAKLAEILKWRKAFGAELQERTGREPEAVLFLNYGDRPDRVGLARNDQKASAFNRTLKRWGERFNAWAKEQGHPEYELDVELLASHKIGRPVYLTHRAASGVPEKVLMDEAGIGDHRTLERYLRFGTKERRDLMARADRHNGNGHEGGESSAPVEAIDRIIDGLEPAIRQMVEPLLMGARETIRRMLSNGKGAA